MLLFYLFFLGFAVGLSGVLIPGPLLVYTVSETLRKGFVGHIIISAHVLIEIFVVILLTLGLRPLIASPLLQQIVEVTGGIALLLTGFYLLYLASKKAEIAPSGVRYTPFLGGLIFTALNPTFPAWWVTVGSAIVFESMKLAGMAGIALMMVGHWTGDISWYSFISYTVAKTRKFLDIKKYRAVMAAMAFVLILIGLHFLL